jgi:hypothetical protein
MLQPAIHHLPRAQQFQEFVAFQDRCVTLTELFKDMERRSTLRLYIVSSDFKWGLHTLGIQSRVRLTYRPSPEMTTQSIHFIRLISRNPK